MTTTADGTQVPATAVPQAPASPTHGETDIPGGATTPRPPRRRMSGMTNGELAALGGCGVSSFLLTWLIFARLADGIGWLGFLIFWYVAFIGMTYVVTWETLGRPAAADRVASVIIRTGMVGLVLPLGLLLAYVVVQGSVALRPGFFIHDLTGITPTMPPTTGGALHSIVGTLEQLVIALVFTIPLSVLTAIYLNETRSRFRRPLRILVDAMSGLPSIVAGLFIYAAIIIPLQTGFMGFAASLALSIVMIPTVTRTIEVVLRLVPGGLREASLALGATRARTVWSVVLPTARTGVTTAIVLGIARTVGETAPLLFTSFGQSVMNANPFKDPQDSLPLFVYANVQKPSVAAEQRGFAGALVLIAVVLALFAVARFVGRDRSRSKSRAASRATSGAASSTRRKEPR
jgi:phosphate transport system permease protein